MSRLWQSAGGPEAVGPIAGTLLRMVESQEQVATARLVRSLDRQAVLEDMLESTKPPLPAGTARLGYLLAAPFRYPPLRHGSRFGNRHEPGIFYGSLTVPTLLAEVAYYRFLFWHDMATPPARPLTTQHTVFAARYATRQGVQLQAARFESHRKTLRHRSDYRATQTLGTAMREAGVEAFEYPSARDPHAGVNVGLFSPAALADTRPHRQEPWIAETATDAVTFVGGAPRSVHRFTLGAFLVRSRLPRAAA